MMKMMSSSATTRVCCANAATSTCPVGGRTKRFYEDDDDVAGAKKSKDVGRDAREKTREKEDRGNAVDVGRRGGNGCRGRRGGDDEEREEKWHLDRESERRIFVSAEATFQSLQKANWTTRR